MLSVDKKVLTLCVVYNNKQILLGMKKRGFGQGRWNGFGGKVEEGESIVEAAYRELVEEAGIHAHALQKRGILTFSFNEDPIQLEVHVFSASKFSGSPNESDEMRPQWFLHSDIPYGDMWPDDIYWLPKVLSGKNIEGQFYFKNTESINSYQLKEI